MKTMDAIALIAQIIVFVAIQLVFMDLGYYVGNLIIRSLS